MIRSFDGSIIERIDKGENSIAAAEELCLVARTVQPNRNFDLGLDNFFYYYDVVMGQVNFLIVNS